jgi:hypothetical protein
MQRAADLLLNLAMQGEMGRVLQRWPATSLVELRDAIDDVIRTTAHRGEENVQFRPAEIVLVHYPRGDGRPYRIGIRELPTPAPKRACGT